MNPPDIHTGCRLRWIVSHWWSATYELRQDDQVVAWVRLDGSGGAAGAGGREYKLQRSRLPPYIALSDGTHEVIARLALTPKSGFLAEFEDGGSFRLGCVSWFRREWNWTDEDGDTVIASRGSWLEGVVELRVDPSFSNTRRWPLLAVLEIAMRKLAMPWF